MKGKLRTTARFIAGIIFLILGVVGSLLPVLQGWIFFLLAALMFFPNHPRTERTMLRLEPRMPRLVALLRRLGFGKREDDLANLVLDDLIGHHESDPGSEESAETAPLSSGPDLPSDPLAPGTMGNRTEAERQKSL